MQFYILDCVIKTITNAAESRKTIIFSSKCFRVSVENSAFWNINVTDEIRGYWVKRNVIKTFVTFDKDGNLFVSISFPYLRFYFMKSGKIL